MEWKTDWGLRLRMFVTMFLLFALFIGFAGAITVYVGGGATVYETYLEAADELVLTEVPESPDGDVHFPEFGPEWTETDRTTAGDLAFVTYRR